MLDYDKKYLLNIFVFYHILSYYDGVISSQRTCTIIKNMYCDQEILY